MVGRVRGVILCILLAYASVLLCLRQLLCQWPSMDRPWFRRPGLLHFDRVTNPGQRPCTSYTIKPRASHARNDVKLYPCCSSLICDILAPGWGALERGVTHSGSKFPGGPPPSSGFSSEELLSLWTICHGLTAHTHSGASKSRGRLQHVRDHRVEDCSADCCRDCHSVRPGE